MQLRLSLKKRQKDNIGQISGRDGVMKYLLSIILFNLSFSGSTAYSCNQSKIEGYLPVRIDLMARPSKIVAPQMFQVGFKLFKTRASCEAELLKLLDNLEDYQPKMDRGVGNKLFLHSYKEHPTANDKALMCMNFSLLDY